MSGVHENRIVCLYVFLHRSKPMYKCVFIFKLQIFLVCCSCATVEGQENTEIEHWVLPYLNIFILSYNMSS